MICSPARLPTASHSCTPLLSPPPQPRARAAVHSCPSFCGRTSPLGRIPLLWSARAVRNQAQDRKLLATRASSGRGDIEEGLAKEDVIYFAKLFALCTLAAAAVKYGSLVAPAATSPSLPLALVIIYSPVCLSVLLMTWASLSKGDKATW